MVLSPCVLTTAETASPFPPGPSAVEGSRSSPSSTRRLPRFQEVVRRIGSTLIRGTGQNKGQRNKDFLKAYLKKFDADEVEVLRKVYKELSARNPGAGIDKATFLQYFPLPGLWGERLFQRFDYKGLGAVDYEEFLVGVAVCCRGTKCEKIHVLFQVFDLNGDGILQKEELVAMLSNLPNLNRYLRRDPKTQVSLLQHASMPPAPAATASSIIVPSLCEPVVCANEQSREEAGERLRDFAESIDAAKLDRLAAAENGSGSLQDEKFAMYYDPDLDFDEGDNDDEDADDLFGDTENDVDEDDEEDNDLASSFSHNAPGDIFLPPNSFVAIPSSAPASIIPPSASMTAMHEFDATGDNSPAIVVPTTSGIQKPTLGKVPLLQPGDSQTITTPATAAADHSKVDVDSIDVEAFVDKIIEECEFSDSDTLTFIEFKTWLEKNDAILAMFNDCLHEEAWGLQGNALYRRRVPVYSSVRTQRAFGEPSRRFHLLGKNLCEKVDDDQLAPRATGNAAKRGVVDIRPDTFYKIKRLFTVPAHGGTLSILSADDTTDTKSSLICHAIASQTVLTGVNSNIPLPNHHNPLSLPGGATTVQMPSNNQTVSTTQTTTFPSIIIPQRLGLPAVTTSYVVNELAGSPTTTTSGGIQANGNNNSQPLTLSTARTDTIPEQQQLLLEDNSSVGTVATHETMEIYPKQTREVLNLQLLDLIASSNPNVDIAALSSTRNAGEEDLLGCPSCGSLLVVCPHCHRRFPKLRLNQGAVVAECQSCVDGKAHQFSNCWHCNWKFSEAVDHVDQCEPLCEGSLYKIGRHTHKWRRRYFVLIDNLLYYYNRKEDTKPRGFIFLEGCFVEPLSTGGGRLGDSIHANSNIDSSSQLIKLAGTAGSSSSSGGKYGFSITHGGGKLPRRDLYAANQTEQKLWINSLRSAMKQQNIEDLYSVGNLVGQGKFSVVHKAITKDTQEEVAIKFIDKSKITGHETELLRSEIAILRLLHHPHVIQFREILDTQATIHIVMEYIEGGELYDLLQQRHRLPELHVNRIIFQLLSTVAYLHKCGIIHRDLKPENILLTNSTVDAHIKITDFGLSCICGPDELVTQPCGTLAYVAPEVLTLQGYNHKVDVWSVGVIMYLLLRGRLPFPVGRPTGQLGSGTHYHRPLAFEGSVWDSVCSSAKDLLRKLLQPQPEKRISAQDALQHIWLKNPTAVMISAEVQSTTTKPTTQSVPSLLMNNSNKNNNDNKLSLDEMNRHEQDENIDDSYHQVMKDKSIKNVGTDDNNNNNNHDDVQSPPTPPLPVSSVALLDVSAATFSILPATAVTTVGVPSSITSSFTPPP